VAHYTTTTGRLGRLDKSHNNRRRHWTASMLKSPQLFQSSKGQKLPTEISGDDDNESSRNLVAFHSLCLALHMQY